LIKNGQSYYVGLESNYINSNKKKLHQHLYFHSTCHISYDGHIVLAKGSCWQ